MTVDLQGHGGSTRRTQRMRHEYYMPCLHCRAVTYGIAMYAAVDVQHEPEVHA